MSFYSREKVREMRWAIRTEVDRYANIRFATLQWEWGRGNRKRKATVNTCVRRRARTHSSTQLLNYVTRTYTNYRLRRLLVLRLSRPPLNPYVYIRNQVHVCVCLKRKGAMCAKCFCLIAFPNYWTPPPHWYVIWKRDQAERMNCTICAFCSLRSSRGKHGRRSWHASYTRLARIHAVIIWNSYLELVPI